VSVRENLALADGFFENNKASQIEIIKVLRAYQPDIVFCNAINDRHIDHGKGSKLASDACFLSGLRKIETQRDGKVQEAWRPKLVYHYIQWKNLKPDVVVMDRSFLMPIAKNQKHQYQVRILLIVWYIEHKIWDD